MQDVLAALLAGDEGQVLTPIQARITRAALDLFAEQGYDATTTLQIAQRAGVTEKTLFRHFGSKKQLFAQTVYPALLSLVQPLLFEHLRSIITSEWSSLRDVLHAIISERVQFAREHPEILKLIVQELVLHSTFREPFIQFWQAQLLAGMRSLLQRAKERGELRDLPDVAVVRALISLTIGYLLQRTLLMPDLPWDDEAEVHVLVDLLMRGISTSAD